MYNLNLLRFLLFGVITICCCFSCKQKIDDPYWESSTANDFFNDSLTLTRSRTITLILDSASILYYETCQFDDRSQTVVSYNSANSDMLLFDYNTGRIKKKFNLTGIGIKPKHPGDQKAYSFNFVNADSIFFYEHHDGKVILFDTSAKVLRTYAIESKENGYSRGLLVMGELLSLSNDSLYIASAPGRPVFDERAPLKDNIILTTSLSTGESRPRIRYPDIYRKAKWGSYLHRYHMLFNKEGGNVVISYPIDHFICVYDSNGQCKRFYSGGKDIKAVRPLRFVNDNSPPGKEEDASNFRSQRTYGSILFDRYRGLYYRVISSAIPEKDFERATDRNYRKEQPMTIVILNSLFSKVGEVAIDANRYSATSMFVSREGLCIPLTTSNDDKLIFDVLSVQTK